MAESRVNLGGSEKRAVRGGRAIGPVHPDERLTVTVEVRRRQDLSANAVQRAPLSREAFALRYGASPGDLLRVREFAAAHGLRVVSESAAKRTLALSGTASAMRSAFGADLRHYQIGARTYRVRSGAITIPAALDGVITAVLGLDNRPQAEPHYRLRDTKGIKAHAAGKSYAPNRVAKLYGFPSGDGAGQTIAIIELGGGFAPDDLTTYFGALGVPLPTVTAVSVDGAANNPGVDTKADGEVMLDIEVAGAVAPAANQLVYFAPNTDQGFLNAIKHAIHDAPSKPAAISISWGGRESTWTQQTRQAFEQAFTDAAVLGITVCVASGDDGSSDGAPTGLEVDFPASAPHALACGGTRLDANGAITAEVVWNSGGGATGGGVSAVFPLPSYQTGAHVPAGSPGGGRGVPDVAGDADPDTGYKVRVDGSDTVIGGTSAVAPLWAGLVARLNAKIGAPVGFLNPAVYATTAASAFNDITVGNNDVSGAGGQFQAGAGWDACTGLGSPRGDALLAVLKSVVTKPPTTKPPTTKPPTTKPPTTKPPTTKPPTTKPPTHQATHDQATHDQAAWRWRRRRWRRRRWRRWRHRFDWRRAGAANPLHRGSTAGGVRGGRDGHVGGPGRHCRDQRDRWHRRHCGNRGDGRHCQLQEVAIEPMRMSRGPYSESSWPRLPVHRPVS